MALKEQFEKVGSDGVEFRGVPFWSWNEELDVEELRRQVQEIAGAGLGGHFMHARSGLITEYMGSEWMQCIKEAVAASKQAGIKAWLYDEDRWPSGAAGGAVPALGEEYVAKRLCWEEICPAEFKLQGYSIATFLVKSGGRGLSEIRQVEPQFAARMAKETETLLHFYYQTNAGYTDLLNRKAVKEFMRHTHQAYQRAVGREFGAAIPGIFTDEPQWSTIPWSTELPGFFKKFKGYDLVPMLPALVYETGDFTAVRYDFWHAATELFVESFTKQIGEWCAKRKLALTGHINAEDTLASQMQSVGAAMPHYEHMQIPGIDHLGRRITDPLLCKQVSSVAHQFGGRRVLSEMFGCSGWNVSFEELKWIAEWQFVQGVDLVCEHLSLYSARGCRKRDYPPSLHYQQPWWSKYRLLNDYFARLTFMLTRGTHVADVLLLHNIESGWASYDPDDTNKLDTLNKSLVLVSTSLLGSHYDFDFGDETILARHARVSQGKLRVKSCEYTTVIVPPCVTLRSTTVRLLARFVKFGGDVILVGPAPALMDGRASDKPAELLRSAARAKPNAQSIKAELHKAVKPRIEVLDSEREDATNIYVQQRHTGLQQIYFLANISKDDHTRAMVRLPGGGRLERWDAETGEAQPVKTRKRGKFVEAELDFHPMGSHLLVLSKRRKRAIVKTRKASVVKRIQLADAWTLERTEPNALTIDACSYRVGKSLWSEQIPVLTVQDNLGHIAGSAVCEFKYSFRADFSAKLPDYVHLVMEKPDACEVSINGLPVGSAEPGTENDLGWWRDISFRRFDVSHLLKPQETNEIVLRRSIAGEAERKQAMDQPETSASKRNRLRCGPEIEAVYILGEFLVRSQARFKPLARRAVRTDGGFVLADNWGQVTTGNLVEQGLPFYAGSARLSQIVKVEEKALKSAKGAKLELDRPDAITTTVYVNGKPVSTRAWPPYEFEVRDLLAPGRNEITVELTGSCRNLLGPHHHMEGELYNVGPASFRGIKGSTDSQQTSGTTWTDAYTFARFGLAGPVSLTLWK